MAQQRIERDAEIVGHNIGGDLEGAGIGIDLDLGEVRAVWKGHERILGREFLAGARPAREVGKRDRAIGATR
jgi:hypothetical protein